MCASKMQNHGLQCFITVPVVMRNVFFIRRPIRPCDMHNTANVFFNTIHGLDFNAASQDFRKENGNEQYCFELEWNF